MDKTIPIPQPRLPNGSGTISDPYIIWLFLSVRHSIQSKTNLENVAIQPVCFESNWNKHL